MFLFFDFENVQIISARKHPSKMFKIGPNKTKINPKMLKIRQIDQKNIQKVCKLLQNSCWSPNLQASSQQFAALFMCGILFILKYDLCMALEILFMWGILFMYDPGNMIHVWHWKYIRKHLACWPAGCHGKLLLNVFYIRNYDQKQGYQGLRISGCSQTISSNVVRGVWGCAFRFTPMNHSY